MGLFSMVMCCHVDVQNSNMNKFNNVMSDTNRVFLIRKSL